MMDTMTVQSKADMAWKHGSRDGVQCWCGEKQASGLTHQKVFHPTNCGSEKCRELQARYDTLPDGNESDWGNIFGG